MRLVHLRRHHVRHTVLRVQQAHHPEVQGLLGVLTFFFKKTLEDGSTREVMHLLPALAPYKVAVLPLIKKNHSEKAMEVFNLFAKNFPTTYDETANIGKRYRRQDAIGTPFCVTVDDETINNNTVTIRDRDTMEQITLPVDEVVSYIEERVKF